MPGNQITLITLITQRRDHRIRWKHQNTWRKDVAEATGSKEEIEGSTRRASEGRQRGVVWRRQQRQKRIGELLTCLFLGGLWLLLLPTVTHGSSLEFGCGCC